jgi:hypothetical protein
MWLLALQLFKNSIDTKEKLRLNLHSLSVSELLEYGRKFWKFLNCCILISVEQINIKLWEFVKVKVLFLTFNI